MTGIQPIVAEYSCQEGTLVGPESRTCLENGSWSGEEPSCVTGMNEVEIFSLTGEFGRFESHLYSLPFFGIVRPGSYIYCGWSV